MYLAYWDSCRLDSYLPRIASQCLSLLIVSTALSLSVCAANFHPTNEHRISSDAQAPTRLALASADDADAERALAEAERLRSQWTKTSLLESIKKYHEAQADWHRLNKRMEEADAIKKIGDVYLILSQSQKALKYYNQALCLSRAASAKQIEIDALNSIANLSIDLGQTHKALQYCAQALKLSRDIDYRAGEAQALNNLGLLAYFFSDLEKALDLFNQALGIWKMIASPRGQAETLTNLGYAQSDLGDINQALDSFREALLLWQQAKDRRGEALVITVIGLEQTWLGDVRRALESHHQAYDFFCKIDDRTGKALIATGLGYIYYLLGDLEKSLDSYQRAEKLYREVGRRASAAVALGHIGRAYDVLGDKQKALACFRRKLAINRYLRDPRMDAYTLKDMGMIYSSIGQKRRALELYMRALLLSQRARDPRGQAYILNEIGYLYDRSGQQQKALDVYTQSLTLLRAAEDRSGVVQTLHNMARAKRNLGDLAGAKAQLEDALSMTESLRRNVDDQDLRASYFASVHKHFELYIDVLMRMHKQQPTAGFNAEALEASERARARGLLDMLTRAHTEIHVGGDAALLQREQNLSSLLDAKSARLAKLLSDKRTDAQVAAVKKEIADLSAEYQQAQEQLRSTSPQYAALTQPHTLTAAEIQKEILDPDTVLLEYSLGDERSHVWVVTTSAIKSYELPGRAEIEKAARPVLKTLATYPLLLEGKDSGHLSFEQLFGQYCQQAAFLSRILIAPLASDIENKRLLVVADGILQYIPFTALAVANQNSATGLFEPLIVKHEIINIPSASIFAALRQQVANRQRPKGVVAVLADPVFEKNDARVKKSGTLNAPPPAAAKRQGLLGAQSLARSLRSGDDPVFPRLLATRIEAEKIISCVKSAATLKALDFEASRSLVTGPEMMQYGILHIATHGLLDSEHPEMSALVLSLVDEHGEAQDGFLRLHDIYNLNLPIDLVVLSACSTALGKDIRGEGLIGITRGFMYAGAARVVASLWKVEDDATAELMQRFYSKMLEEGKRPAAALREAQVEMWKGRFRKDPYFWAAFVFQGEWR